jgi:hypothetical protein
LEFTFAGKCDKSLDINPGGAGDGTGGLHFAKGDVFVIRNYSATGYLAAFLPIDDNNTVLLPFRYGFSRTDSSADWVSTVITGGCKVGYKKVRPITFLN